MTRPIPPRKLRPQLPLAAYRWLLQGQRSSWYYLNIHAEDEQRAFWQANRDAVVAWYIKRRPGFRPLLWWRFDAPEPRRRVGGIGTPLSECEGAHAALFEFGLPLQWKTCEHHHQLLVGVPISRAHPPMYEAEAEYLRRHKLFLPGERKRLGRRAFEPCVLVRRNGMYVLCRHDRVPARTSSRDEVVSEEFARVGPLRPSPC
jgi:hypothetical protein